MPTNYNPYLQSFQNQYPAAYSSFAPAQAVVAPVQPVARPVMSGNVLGYQVDGEVGAKAFPFQNGSNEPLVLWDMNDSVFYLRSYNQAGFPNPLKRYRFVEEEMPQALPAGMSGNSMANTDMSQMATRNEMDELRKEVQRLTALVNQYQMQGQNSNQMSQNQSANSGPAFIQNGSHSNGNSGNNSNNGNASQQNRR